MTDYDDALLEDDILSLPDLNDEKNDLILIDSQTKPNNELNNFLDLDIFDAFEESLDVEENNKKFKIKELNNCEEEFIIQQKDDKNSSNDEDRLNCYKNDSYESDVESTLMALTNSTDSLKTDLRTSLKNQIQDIIETTMSHKHGVNNNLSNMNKNIVNACNDNTFERYQLLNTQIHHQLSNQNKPYTMYQSCQYDQQGSQFIPETMNHIANASFVPLECNQHYISSLGQPYNCSYSNQNVYFKNSMQYLPLQNSIHSLNPYLPVNNILPFHESSSTNSTFTLNQKLPMNQILPFNQSLPVNHYLQPSTITNEVTTSNQCMQMMENSHTLMPHYLQSSYVQHSLNNINKQNRYLMNPLQIYNNLNIHKILINRDFTQNITRKEVKITNKAVRHEEFSKHNLSKTTHHKNNIANNDVKTDDPYLYFSDVWQQKKIQNEINQRPFSSEVIIFNNKQNNKKVIRSKMRSLRQKQNKNKKQKSNNNKNKTNTNNGSKNKNATRRMRQRQLKKSLKQINGKIDNNNNDKNKQNSKIKTELLEIPKKEEKMNSELEDYCKKVEEQKKLREIFLKQKEQRRKILAMEKLGIKKESFTKSE